MGASLVWDGVGQGVGCQRAMVDGRQEGRSWCHLYGCIWSKYLIRLGGADVQTSLIRMTAKSSVTDRGTKSVNIFSSLFYF
jgi:hypothetical protein